MRSRRYLALLEVFPQSDQQFPRQGDHADLSTKSGQVVAGVSAACQRSGNRFGSCSWGVVGKRVSTSFK